MGWLTKFLKGSNHKHSGRGYTGKYGHDRDSDNHDNSADDLNDFEREEIDRAIAISLSEVTEEVTEEDHKGKKVIGKIYAFARRWLKCCFV